MDLVARLESLWAPLSATLGHVQDRQVSLGASLVLLGCTVAVLIAALLAQRYARRRLVRDEEAGVPWTWLVRRRMRIPAAVVGVALGLHYGGIVPIGDLLFGIYAVVHFPLIDLAGTPVSVVTITTVGLIVAGSFWLSRMLQKAVQRGARMGLGPEQKPGSVAVIQRLVHYLVIATGVTIALQMVGVNLSALFAAGAIFAVGIGFAMQNIAQNFVSGLILLVERAIKPGDVIQVEGRVVRVERIGIRSTVVRTRDEEDLIVPNSILSQSTVANLTFLDPSLRIRCPVGVSYGSDMELVYRTLREAVLDVPHRDPRQEPVVFLLQFGSSSVDFEVSVWTREPWFAPLIRSEVNRAIWREFQAADITISFPQVDVHLDEPVIRAIAGGAR
ncbi:MAG: mechanosensitive ion channel [Deltaproteobacteria bacterium]|nr:mechanosensitive ion channel [Deltaproteobacteria bacterium]